MGIGDRITLLARRTTRPYRVLGRTVVGLVGALVVLFLLLLLLRVAIVPTDCPEVAVTTATGQLVHVRLACKPDSWMQSFCASVIDNLAAGLIVVSVSTFMLWLVSPKEQVEEDIAALEPWNIPGGAQRAARLHEELLVPRSLRPVHTQFSYARVIPGGRARFPIAPPVHAAPGSGRD
jgi:hypothetical protein